MYFVKTTLSSIVLTSLLLTACGGGSSDASNNNDNNNTTPGQTGNVFQGNWTASFTGGDSGTCETIVIDANGNLSGSCTSRNIGGASITVVGNVSSTGAATFTAGGASSGATFTGSMLSNGTGSGTWVNTVINGTWIANKKN